MTDPTEHPTGVTLLVDAFRRWSNAPPCVLVLPKHEAWTAMGLFQLLHRHPHLEPDMLDFVERFGRQIQTIICDTPELYAFAESGWNPALDGQFDQEETCPTNPVTPHPPAPIAETIPSPTRPAPCAHPAPRSTPTSTTARTSSTPDGTAPTPSPPSSTTSTSGNPDTPEIQLSTVSFPDPPLHGEPCGACGGKGITGETYQMPTSETRHLLVDVICSTCYGCGNAAHHACAPSAHTDAELDADPDGLEDDEPDDHDQQVCFSCGGRQWWAMQAWPSEPGEDSVMLTLRVPCGCTEDRAQLVDTGQGAGGHHG